MIHHVLATDYDGTLAEIHVPPETVDALRRLRDSGRKLVLVTGRRLDDLMSVFPGVNLFECVVAENGALLYWPETAEEEPLGAPPSPEFLDALRQRGVDPVEVGRVIVATWSPHEVAVLDAIRALGLELQMIFNRGAVMILPTGLNKAVGLEAALKRLGFSAKNVAGVGDAENDVSMLCHCGVSAAVANALPSVQKQADIVLHGERGAGVAELIGRLIENDLRDVACREDRGIEYGADLSDNPLFLPAFGESLMVVGGSGGGKSRFAASFWERLADRKFQTCVIDPEGDYQATDRALVIGTKDTPPTLEEVFQVVADPAQDCVVNLFSVPKEDRPEFFGRLLRGLLEHRSRFGRPHWILVDEAHYAAPEGWQPAKEIHVEELHGMMFISAFPEKVSETAFRASALLVAIGDEPREMLAKGFERIGQPMPKIAPPEDHAEHRALAWHRGDAAPRWFRRIPPRGEWRRHQHDLYAGEMDEEYRFYFRGPENRVNLPAQNLKIFMQLAEGVDEETWDYHLRRGDYSRWMRHSVKDDALAAEVEHVERTGDISNRHSRELIVKHIRERYEVPV